MTLPGGCWAQHKGEGSWQDTLDLGGPAHPLLSSAEVSLAVLFLSQAHLWQTAWNDVKHGQWGVEVLTKEEGVQVAQEAALDGHCGRVSTRAGAGGSHRSTLQMSPCSPLAPLALPHLLSMSLPLPAPLCCL